MSVFEEKRPKFYIHSVLKDTEATELKTEETLIQEINGLINQDTEVVSGSVKVNIKIIIF